MSSNYEYSYEWDQRYCYPHSNVLMYPDLIVVRKDEHGYVFDILEPHDPSRSNNCEKAKGLAKFAESHWALFGRIQLIRKMRGPDGSDHYCRLDMSKASARNKVLAIATAVLNKAAPGQKRYHLEALWTKEPSNANTRCCMKLSRAKQLVEGDSLFA